MRRRRRRRRKRRRDEEDKEEQEGENEGRGRGSSRTTMPTYLTPPTYSTLQYILIQNICYFTIMQLHNMVSRL